MEVGLIEKREFGELWDSEEGKSESWGWVEESQLPSWQGRVLRFLRIGFLHSRR